MKEPASLPSDPAPAAATDRKTLNWGFIIAYGIIHVGAVYTLISHLSWAGIAVLAVTHAFFAWIGIGLCYHRLLAHRSFRVPGWLERTLATIGALNVQGGPIAWVATHLQHHAKSDQPEDPHSPRQLGFWGAHLWWMARGGQKPYGFRALKHLKERRYYRFLEIGQILLQVPLGVLLYLIGGWTFVSFGIFVRLAVSLHVTCMINSVCHVWGSRRYATGDDSRNNHVVNLLAGGEGLHNNHHHDPRAATTRRGFWDFDATGLVIRGLQAVGLAKDVVEPRAGA